MAALRGIGLIRLDPSNPADSEVMVLARERAEIDWGNCDRLAAENSDFSAVVRRLWEFHRTGAAKRTEWTV